MTTLYKHTLSLSGLVKKKVVKEEEDGH